MKKIVLLALVLIIILVAVLVVFLIPREAKPGTIYIRANGDVEGTDKIDFVEGQYIFTDNIFNQSIVVERDAILVAGAGYTLQGTGSLDSKGIDLTGRSNVTIANLEITNFEFGIYLNYSSNNNLAGNTASNNSIGIVLLSSSNNNVLIGNTVSSNKYYGIDLSFSSNNTITGNNASNNGEIYGVGIILDFKCNNNVLTGNTVSGNYVGINHHVSSNNTLFHNNFINNTQQISSANSTNIWDNGVEGNYWSNYTGVDSNNDGIGDTPHAIDANNTDNYPLMGMFYRSGFWGGAPESTVTLVSNSTVSNFDVIFVIEPENMRTRAHILFNVTGEIGYGFCRLCIPKGLMAPPYTVIIDNGETPVLHYNETVFDNSSHRWIYFTYQHSTHKVEIISEFPK